MLTNAYHRSGRRFCLTLWTCLATISALLSLVSCSENNENTKIVATFLPVYLFTQAVTGDSIPVEILVPTNSDVHDYQATPRNIQTLTGANILIQNGLGIEEFLNKLITNAGNSNLVQIDSSAGIEPIKGEDEEHHDVEHDHQAEDEEHHDVEHDHQAKDEEHHDVEHDHQAEDEEHHHVGHHHQLGDPHIWLDPVLAQKQVANIRQGLIAADPEKARIYSTNADAYIAQLQELDQEFTTKLAPVKGCTIISFHDAFAYLTRRYGLEQMVILQTPEENLKPQDIQKVLQAIKEFKVKALLSEPGGDKRIEQIAKDTGLPIETLDSLESGETDPQYYFQVMRQNLASLEKACQP